MPKMLPVSYREFVRRLRKLGFDGPFSGGKHPFMERNGHAYTVLNPHRGDISPSLLRRILRQLEISLEEWDSAG